MPTRFDNTLSSVLNLVFTNQPSEYALSEVIHIVISDHAVIYVVGKTVKPQKAILAYSCKKYCLQPQSQQNKLLWITSEILQLLLKFVSHHKH